MPMRILLIDDEPESVKQECLSPLLENPDLYEILTDDGASIQRVQELLESVDIVLLDQHLGPPGSSVTGLSVLREIRSSPEDREAPVILLSKYSDLGGEEVWLQFLRLRVADFISKNTPPEIIKYKIDKEVAHARDKRMLKNLMPTRSPASLVPQDALALIGEKVIADPGTWRYCERLCFEEGPPEEGLANSAVLAVISLALGKISESLALPLGPYNGETLPVQMHVPPHLRDGEITGRGTYPLGAPVRCLREVFAGREDALRRVLEALTVGPPHHVISRLILLHCFESAYQAAVS